MRSNRGFVGGVLRSRWLRVGGLSLLGLVGVALSVGAIRERTARAAAVEAFPPPGRMIEVEGGPLHLYCTGQGGPTVVLEAGASQPSVAWSPVQTGVAAFTRVCSYDRAGVGWSAAADGGVGAEEIVYRLRAVLAAADVAPPFVLVGHSMGGPLAMVFGDLYPGEVVGYVFVDATDPDMYEMLPVQPPEAPAVARALAGAATAFTAAVGMTRRQMRGVRKPDHWPQDVFDVAVAFAVQNSVTGSRERAALPALVRRAARVESFGSAPVVVLTARSSLTNTGAPMEPEVWAQARRDMQDAIAARSTNGTRRMVDDSGHNVHMDAPGETIRAIRDVVEAVRTGEGLPGGGR